MAICVKFNGLKRGKIWIRINYFFSFFLLPHPRACSSFSSPAPSNKTQAPDAPPL
ncbi:hypothetical protein SLEP1_g27756 [Rubroshorea leprosula]|uniref:Uncharacterized protein n=1 Tax=Rubroshorea leprosula TaxID=152421 RepID=A0AAV5K145_9ROSI|nr:hypothetical protein SLEP1_g27756 [Rubroshorea leprosula]